MKNITALAVLIATALSGCATTTPATTQTNIVEKAARQRWRPIC